MSRKDHPVGYKRTPLATRFQPGQSGNPKGRPKGAKNLATDLKEELEERISITEGGKSREISKQRAMLKALMARALRGDSRAAQTLIQLTLALEQSEADKAQKPWMEDEDRAILEAFTRRLTAAADPDPTRSETDDAEPA